MFLTASQTLIWLLGEVSVERSCRALIDVFLAVGVRGMVKLIDYIVRSSRLAVLKTYLSCGDEEFFYIERMC